MPPDEPLPGPTSLDPLPPPKRRGGPVAVVASVGVAWVVLLLVAFAITGTLLTVTVFLLPVLTVVAILYLVWSTRRGPPPAATETHRAERTERRRQAEFRFPWRRKAS
jgi:threonine/homoserine/homoserine lactone efflux protein